MEQWLIEHCVKVVPQYETEYLLTKTKALYTSYIKITIPLCRLRRNVDIVKEYIMVIFWPK